MDIADFLRARLDEDEYDAKVAQLRAPAPWSGESREDGYVLSGEGLVDANGNGIAIIRGGYIWQHIARHDPARVLADVGAKRTIVTIELSRALDAGHAGANRSAVLRLLAEPYAAHPDYDADWAASG